MFAEEMQAEFGTAAKFGVLASKEGLRIIHWNDINTAEKLLATTV